MEWANILGVTPDLTAWREKVAEIKERNPK